MPAEMSSRAVQWQRPGSRLVPRALLVVTGIVLLAVVAVAPAAAAQSPTEQLRQTVYQVLQVLRDGSGDSEAKRQRILEIARTRFDFTAMSRRVLGPYWKEAGPDEQARFVELFTELLGRTYQTAIDEYAGESVEFTGESIRKERFAEVKTQVVGTGPAIPIDYRMFLRDGQWWGYDFVVEGVSLVNNYRSSFQDIVRGRGMPALIQELESKLAEPMSGS